MDSPDLTINGMMRAKRYVGNRQTGRHIRRHGKIFGPYAAAALLTLALTCCTSPKGTTAVEDPLEPVNRAVFAFNTAIDKVAVRPATEVYDTLIPGFVRGRIRDFLFFLKTPVILTNDLLQADGDRAAVTTGRFVVNAIAGMGGLVDMAKRMGAPGHNNGFAQTFTVWGVGSGPYLVLPLLGPSTVTDATGAVVDWAVDPLRWDIDEDTFTVARAGLEGLERRAALLGVLDNLEKTSVDYYIAVQSSYMQRRQAVLDKRDPDAPSDPQYRDLDIPDAEADTPQIPK